MSEPIGVREAARRLNVHENTVRNWKNRGILPSVAGPAGYSRFDPEDVEELAEKQKAYSSAKRPQRDSWLRIEALCNTLRESSTEEMMTAIVKSGRLDLILEMSNYIKGSYRDE
jgi:hypothetical protein